MLEWVALAVVVVVGLPLVSVGGLLLAGTLGGPSVTAVDHRLVHVDDDETVVESDLVVTNASRFPLPLSRVEVDYSVSLNGIVVGEGTEPGRDLPPGDTAVTVQTRFHNDHIPAWWSSHVTRDEHTRLNVDATLRTGVPGLSYSWQVVDEDLTTDIGASFAAEGTVPVGVDAAPVSGPLLYVEDTGMRWRTASEVQTAIELCFDVYNPLPSPVPVESLDYELRMNGVTVATGDSENLLPIPPDATRTVTAELTVDNAKLVEWWVTHASRDQESDLTLDYDVRFGFTQFLVGLRFSPDSIDRTVVTNLFEPDADSLDVSVR